MNTSLFTDDQFARMADEVRQVLREIGYQVAHPKLKQMALDGGCTESAAGRVLFHDAQIEEITAKLQEQYPKPKAHHLHDRLHPKWTPATSWGNITPKVFNYARQMPEGGNAHNLAQLVKFAHSATHITGLTLPLSRQDLPPQVEQIESLVLMAKLTDKPLGALDVTVPEAVPFVARMGEALGRDPAQFVGCCNCINPPLRLEERTAETMLQRAPLHSMSMITPMPCIGGSSPMDTYGSIIQGTAEVVGGLILSSIMDTECRLMGWIASVQVDMRTGNITSSSPQTVQVDAGVYQLMEKHFGGGTRVGGRTYVSARKPGFAAVYEKLLKTVGYSQLVDDNAINYAGGGTLDNGSMTSPEQLLLDLEVLEGMAALTQQPVIPAEGEIMQRLREGIIDLGGNFLIHDHTLTTYRQEMWDPQYFQRATRGRTEKEMLDQAHEEVQRRIEEYQPASHPADVVRELEKIAAQARAVLL
jgi:trimethylamine:corrinoid methyltransferase-like protein